MGSLLSNRSKVSVVITLSPLGWMTDFGGSCILLQAEGALVASSEMLAAVSIKAVLVRFGGLVQPGEIVAEQSNKKILSGLSITKCPAGSARQVFGLHAILC